MRYAIFSILALAFLVTACGGEAGAPSTDTTVPDASGSDASGDATAPADSGSKGGAEDEFERALSGFMTGSFMVSYDITMSDGDETLSMTTTQYFDGPDRMRTDATAMGTETRTYIMGDEFVTCFNQDGEWSCMLLTSGESGESSEAESPDAFSDLTEYAESDEEALDYTVSRDGTMAIAGVTAECFRISSSENTARYCIHDGVPLYMSAEDPEGQYEMKATSYSTRVSASDFAYPAEPSEGFGGMMGGFGDDFNPEDFENMDWGEFDPSMYE